MEFFFFSTMHYDITRQEIPQVPVVNGNSGSQTKHNLIPESNITVFLE